MLSLVVLATLVVLCLMLAFTVRLRKLAHVPGPTAFPLIGCAHRFVKHNDMSSTWEELKEMSRKYGKAFKFWMGPFPIIMTYDISTIKTVNSSIHCLDKGFFMSFFNTITDGVFVATGKKWEELRKLLNQSMGPRHLQEYIEAFNRKSSLVVTKLSKDGRDFMDPLLDIGNAYLDIGFQTHWGVETDLIHNDETNLHKTVQRQTESILFRMFRPWYYPKSLYKLSQDYRKFRPLAEICFDFLSKKVEERQKLRAMEDNLPQEDARKRKNVYLDMMIDWCASQGKTDPYFVQEQTADILIAASDTTSAIFCQMLYHVAADPEVQAKLQEEIDSLYPGEEVFVTKEDLKKLVYTEMVIKETLRLYCPPNTTRYVAKDIQTDIGVIPSGTTFASCHYQVHRNPEHWERPDEFYPEHFTEEAQLKRPKGAFLPFLTGPRNCPGKIYAYWVMKVMLVHFIKRLRVETDMKDIKHKFLFILVPTDGFSIRFRPRD